MPTASIELGAVIQSKKPASFPSGLKKFVPALGWPEGHGVSASGPPGQAGAQGQASALLALRCQQRSCGYKGESQVREKSKVWLLVEGVLKLTVLFLLEMMVKTQCQVSCPTFLHSNQ